jgi:hypothetical protein
MNVIPASRRIFKYMVMNDYSIIYGTDILSIKLDNNCCKLMDAGGTVFLNFYNGDKRKLYIPPTIEFMDTNYLVKLTPSIKYLNVDYVKEPFTINVDLDYLCLHEIWGNELSTRKKIKFLSVGCVHCLNGLHDIVPYAEYIILRSDYCTHKHKYLNKDYDLTRLKCIFAERKRFDFYGKLRNYPIYTFMDLNNETYVSHVKYLFE